MKFLLATGRIFLSGLASAQDNGITAEDILKKFQKKKSILVLRDQPQASLTTPETYAFTTPDGNKVHTLTMDNMPCVAPDMNQFNLPCIKPPLEHYNMPVQKTKLMIHASK